MSGVVTLGGGWLVCIAAVGKSAPCLVCGVSDDRDYCGDMDAFIRDKLPEVTWTWPCGWRWPDGREFDPCNALEADGG